MLTSTEEITTTFVINDKSGITDNLNFKNVSENSLSMAYTNIESLVKEESEIR